MHKFTPVSHRFLQPAEWDPHAACWLAWPSDESLWQKNLGPAQKEFVAFCRKIYEFGDRLKILVADNKNLDLAKQQLGDLNPEFFNIPFGDIWLRDTAPIFARNVNGSICAATFSFNGWGNKYVLEFDNCVSSRVAEASTKPIAIHNWVLEGGSIECDGEGTILTSRQCLLNKNRNPNLSQAQVESKLQNALGAQKILWVSDGLINDHTDGHIDTIARYIAPAEVVCMAPSGVDDPNADILNQIFAELSSMSDAKGRKLTVHQIPSPGRMMNSDGDIMPASYVNFYIANCGVIVPTYGSLYDKPAIEALSKIFKGRKVCGLSALAILSGGGAFHCITQQEPVDKSLGELL